jgi:hypothetical protein
MGKWYKTGGWLCRGRLISGKKREKMRMRMRLTLAENGCALGSLRLLEEPGSVLA